GAANAVLIANTYHELTNPAAMLGQIFQSLVPDGRLVIVDQMQTEHGKFSPDLIERELRHRGFDIVSRNDRFVDHPVRGLWWLIVARRPSGTLFSRGFDSKENVCLNCCQNGPLLQFSSALLSVPSHSLVNQPATRNS